MAAASFALRFHLPRAPSPLFLSLSCLRILHSPVFSSPFPSPSLPFPCSSHRPSLRFLCSYASSSLSVNSTSPLLDEFKEDPLSESKDEPDGKELEGGVAEEEEDDEEEEIEAETVCVPLPNYPSPKLSVKEKKELASYAHSLGKKLKAQQVGKAGVTPSLAASFIETLEANELLKLKVQNSCPGELNDVISQLERATGSVAVDQIGRSAILYRPSLGKMRKEAEGDKKGMNSKSRQSVSAILMQKKGRAPRASDRKHDALRKTT